MATGKKAVVIIGGGFAGCKLYKLLHTKFAVTLIDSKDYFEFTPSNLRCFVQPDHGEKTVVRHPKGTVIGTVQKVKPPQGQGKGEVFLSDGQTILFDYCIVATGSSYTNNIKPDPKTPPSVEDRLHQFRDVNQLLLASKHIVIVGGGMVGVELAAEVVCEWTTKYKKVTLLTSKDRLLDLYEKDASSYAAKWLTSRGVDVRYNERVTDWGAAGATPGPATITTDSGATIQGDVVFRCVGQKAAVVEVEGAKLASNGALQVDHKTLQVLGAPGVYAAGDCNDVPEEKCAISCVIQAMFIANKLISEEKGKNGAKYPEDVTGGKSHIPSVYNVSLGKQDGVMVMKGKVTSGKMAAFSKGVTESLVVSSTKGGRISSALMSMMHKGMAKS